VLKYDRNLIFLKHRICWFSPSAPRFSLMRFDEYRQSFEKMDRKWYRRTNFNTILIDLSEDMSQIFSRFNATTRKEVRRAERTGVEVSELQDWPRFVEFYNEFAMSKKRGTISLSELSNYRDNIVIRAAGVGGNTLIMHSYIFDNEIGYVRQFHTASHFRLYENNSERHAASAANCYLLFSDIAYFKDRNFKIFDLGGVPPAHSTDAAANQIAQFKRRFGGVEVEHFNYTSLNLALALNVKAAVARLLSRSKSGLGYPRLDFQNGTDQSVS
jgi:FemAB family